MAKYHTYSAAQSNRPETITYREFTSNGNDSARLRAEGANLITSELSADYNKPGKSIASLMGDACDWVLYDSTANRNIDANWYGQITNADLSSTQLSLFFEPSISANDVWQSDAFYLSARANRHGWPMSDNAVVGAGSDNWLLCSESKRVVELAIDLTNAAEESYTYLITGNIDISCDTANHSYFAEAILLEGQDEVRSVDSIGVSANYNTTRFYSEIANRNDHWQVAAPVSLEGGKFYKVAIRVGSFVSYHGYGGTGASGPANTAWTANLKDGAKITARGGALHALRIDNTSYIAAGTSIDNGQGDHYEVGAASDNKTNWTDLSDSASNSDKGIVRQLTVDTSSLKSGEYLVFLSAVLGNASSNNYSGEKRPIESRVYFGHVTSKTEDERSHKSLITHKRISWPGDGETSSQSYATLDQKSIGAAAVINVKKNYHPSASAMLGTATDELIFAIGSNGEKPSVNSYHIIAVKLSAASDDLDKPGEMEQISFDSVNALSSAAHGAFSNGSSSDFVEKDAGSFQRLIFPEDAEDVFQSDPIKHLDGGGISRPAISTVFLQITPDSMLTAVDGSTPANGAVISAWNDVGPSGRHMHAATNEEGRIRYNAINGYSVMDARRDSGDTDWGGYYLLTAGQAALANVDNCISWVINVREAVDSSGNKIVDFNDYDTTIDVSLDENLFLARTTGGSGTATFSEWRIKRHRSGYEQFIWYTAGVAHTLTYGWGGDLKGWADQEWRVITSRRTGDYTELWINGRYVGKSALAGSTSQNAVKDQFYYIGTGTASGSRILDRQLAEMIILDGTVSNEELEYHNQRLIDKYAINKYGDPKGFTSDQAKAVVPWDATVTASNNRFRGDTYESAGDYFEVISHGGAEVENESDSKEYGIYSITHAGLVAYNAISNNAADDWGRNWGSQIGGYGQNSLGSVMRDEEDGDTAIRDTGVIYVPAASATTALAMTQTEFDAVEVGDVYKIWDDTSGFQKVTGNLDALNAIANTNVGGFVYVEVIEKIFQLPHTFPDGEELNATADISTRIGNLHRNSLRFTQFGSSEYSDVFGFIVKRIYSDRDCLGFKAARGIGQRVYTFNGSSTITDFSAFTARFKKADPSEYSAEIRPVFKDDPLENKKTLPAYASLSDSDYSMIYKATAFKESNNGPAKGSSLIDYTHWSAGMSMPPSGYTLNGDADENSIANDVGPFGQTQAVWNLLNQDPSGATTGRSQGDGGWLSSLTTIDPTKSYRFSVWVRRKVLGDGRFYLGLRGYENSSNVGVVQRNALINAGSFATSSKYQIVEVGDTDFQAIGASSDTAGVIFTATGAGSGSGKAALINTNPYFEYGYWTIDGDIDGAIRDINKWFLVVGHVYPHNETLTNTGKHDDTGWYEAYSTTKVSDTNLYDFRWSSSATNNAVHRSYLYYSEDETTQQQFAFPRLDLVDGTEPSISDLVNSTAPSSNGVAIPQWADSSGRTGVTVEEQGAGDDDPASTYHMEQATSALRPTTTNGPTGNTAGAIQFSPTGNTGTNAGQRLSVYEPDSGQDPDMELIEEEGDPDDKQYTVQWVINFDKKSGTWYHPLGGNTAGTGAARAVWFESLDEEGNGTLAYHNSNGLGTTGVNHEVRCSVTIPPNSWHVITFRQLDYGTNSNYSGRLFEFYLDGYLVGKTVATEGQSGSANVLKWEHFGNVNGWWLSAKVADIRIRGARSTHFPQIEGAGTYQDWQSSEHDLANTYNITTHKLHASRYTSEPTIPNAPSGSELLVHLKPDASTLTLKDGADASISDAVDGAYVSSWADANGKTYSTNGSGGTVGMALAGSTVASTDLFYAFTSVDHSHAVMDIDDCGNIYFCSSHYDALYRIPYGSTTATALISGTFTPSNSSSSTSLQTVLDLHVDSKGCVYLADNDGDQIIKYDPSDPTTGAAKITLLMDSSGDGSTALNNPRGVTTDSVGNVYVSGYGDPDAVFKITPAGAKSVVLTSTLNGAWGIACDSQDNVYVASHSGNTRVFKITSGGTVSEAMSKEADGRPMVHPDPADTTAAAISSRAHGGGPLAIDSQDNVYAGMYYSDNVFKITPEGIVTEILTCDGDLGSNETGRLYGSKAIGFDADDNVYVAAMDNDKVFRIDAITGKVSVALSGTIGGEPVDVSYSIAHSKKNNTIYCANRSGIHSYKELRPKYKTNIANGYPGILFDGSNTTLTSSTEGNGNYSDLIGGTSHDNEKIDGVNIFAVIKPAHTNNSGQVFKAAAAAYGLGGSSDKADFDTSAFQGTFWQPNSSNADINGNIGIGYHHQATNGFFQYTSPEAGPPFRNLAAIDTSPHVISISYGSDGQPTIRHDGKIVIDYAGVAATSTRGKWVDVDNSTSFILGGAGIGNNLGNFNGYIMEYVVYRKSTSAMTEEDHLGVVNYLLDKYEIPSASRGSYADYSLPAEKGRVGYNNTQILPGFWVNTDRRYSNDKSQMRIESRGAPNARSLGGKSVRVFEPNYIWLGVNQPLDKVRGDSETSVLVDIEKASIISKGWTSGATNGITHYYAKFLDGEQVCRVLINGLGATEVYSNSFTGYDSEWYWDSDQETLYVVMGDSSHDPNTSSHTVTVVIDEHYSRSKEDIIVIEDAVVTSSTTKSPSTSDDSAITTSVIPDSATNGRKSVPYEPRLTSTPGYSQEIQVSGGDVSATSSYGGVSIAAADGKFDKEIARRIFEGLKTDVYIGNSSLENRKQAFEKLATGIQGLPSLSDDEFSFSLFDNALVLNDAIEPLVFEVNSDSGGQVQFAAKDWPIYFGKNLRVPASRVSHAQVEPVASPTEENTVYFKICNHYVNVINAPALTDYSGDHIGVYLDQSTLFPFAVAAHIDDTARASSLYNATFVQDEALARAGMFGIKVDSDVTAFGSSNFQNTWNASQLYVDISGVKSHPRSDTFRNNYEDGLRAVASPGDIFAYMLENHPSARDEENGYYSASLDATYTPRITQSTSNAAHAVTLVSSADMTKFPIGAKVLLRQVVNTNTGEIRKMHGVVVEQNSGDKRVWVQPQFVFGDVRLNGIDSSNTYFRNTSAETFTTASPAAKLLIYSEFNGLASSQIDYESLRKVDKIHRLKQDTNAAANRAVRYPIATQAGFGVGARETLQNALAAIAQQFFVYFHINRSGRASVGVPDLDRNNLLRNAGFESNTLIATRSDGQDTDSTLTTATSITKIASPWVRKNGANFVADNLSTAYVFTGKQSLEISSGTNKAFAEQTLALAPGKYVFTCLMTTGGSGSPNNAGLTVVLPGGEEKEISTGSVAVSGDKWQRVNLPFEIEEGYSGTTLVRIYPNVDSAVEIGSEVAVRVDDCELHPVVAFINEDNATYLPATFEDENFYEVRVNYAENPAVGASNFVVVNDSSAESIGEVVSEGRSAIESSGRLNLDGVRATQKQDALEIAAKAVGYFGQMRASMEFSILDFKEVPKVGDSLYFKTESRSVLDEDDSPFWSISSVAYNLDENANQIQVTALRHLDPVIDRNELTGAGLPIGAVVVCSESACPAGYEKVTGYERLHLGSPYSSGAVDGDVKGSFVHNHTASHNHSESGTHTHTETYSASSSSNKISYSGFDSGNNDVAASDLAVTGSSNSIVQAALDQSNEVECAAASHEHPVSGTQSSSTAGAVGSVSSDSQTTKPGGNDYDYVSILLCRRVGQFYLDSDGTTETENIPLHSTFGWQGTAASAPTGFELNSDVSTSKKKLLQVSGTVTTAVSQTIVNMTAAGDNLAITVASTSGIEVNRRLKATSGSDFVHMVVTGVVSETVFTSTKTYSVLDQSSINYDSHDNATTALTGWALTAPADGPGTSLTDRGYHNHGGTSMLDAHTHTFPHQHGSAAATDSSVELTDIDVSVSSNLQDMYSGDMVGQSSFGSSTTEKRNQMASVYDWQEKTNQAFNTEYGGSFVQANTSGSTLAPINHHHRIGKSRSPTASATSASAAGADATNKGGARLEPANYALNWIRPASSSGNSAVGEVPTGAIILHEGPDCPSGYSFVSDASNLLIATQAPTSTAASASTLSHGHAFKGAAHGTASHNHSSSTHRTERAYLLSGMDSGQAKYSDATSSSDSALVDSSYPYYTTFAGNGQGSGTASTIAYPTLLPMQQTATGLPVSSSTVSFATFMSVSDLVSGQTFPSSYSSISSPAASFDAATKESHYHVVNVSYSSSNFSLAASAELQTSEQGSDEIKPRYRDILLCKKE